MVLSEKGHDGITLGIQDKTGFIHFLVFDDDFADFGISKKETESLSRNLKEGESKRVYVDVE